jgi:hypothetical protein
MLKSHMRLEMSNRKLHILRFQLTTCPLLLRLKHHIKFVSEIGREILSRVARPRRPSASQNFPANADRG